MGAIQKLQVLGAAGRHDICSGCARSTERSHFSGGIAGRRMQAGSYFSSGRTGAGTLFSGSTYRHGASGQWDLLFSGAKYRHGARGSAETPVNRPPKYDGMVYQASTPTGRVPVLKTLLTNECALDCKYCANPVSQSKLSLEPAELARIFFGLWERGRVKGLFLSSAIHKDPDFSMEKIVECARLVRERYSFGGYVHLKVLPGASRESVRMAAELADRLSINLESSSTGRLSEIAPSKEYGTDIVRRQEWIAEEERKGFLKSGHTTQFLVGAAGESDRELLDGLARTYKQAGIRRAYFSAFEPVHNTPFERKPAISGKREFRLYQSDRLLRVYGFSLSEMECALNESGFLQDEDPKLLVARECLDPVDADTAPYSELIKVPGIGPKAAHNIMGTRGKAALGKKKLAEAGVILKRALPFLNIGGSVQARLSGWD